MATTVRRTGNNKYEVVAELTYSDLEVSLPLEAECAHVDMSEDDRRDAFFLILDGDLYAKHTKGPNRGTETVWWFFDCSIRRWQVCDDPT